MKILFVIFLICSVCVFSQKSQRDESLEKLQIVLDDNDFLANEKRKLLVYSINDTNYLIIANQKKYYIEYYANIQNNKSTLRVVNRVKKPFCVLDRSFDLTKYNYEYIDFHSDKYKNYKLAQGNKTFFCIIDENGQFHGEFNLSVIVNPVPIDKELYEYLTQRMLKLTR